MSIESQNESTAIKAEITKEKQSKETIYSFQVNNETFKAYFVPPKKSPTLHIQHNETTLGTIIWEIDKNRKFEYVVNTSTEPITITAWIDLDGKGRSRHKSIGIEANGVPVQHTLADPQTLQKISLKNWSAILLAFVLLITSFGPFKQTLDAISLSFTHYVPFLIVGIISVAKYKSLTMLALFADAYLLILEIRHIIEIGTFSNSYVAMWFLMRIGTLCALLYIFKKERVLRTP